MPYALLQLSLDQTIERTALEEAVTVTSSVARADCALLQRELFGIVVGNLERTEAFALQAALRGHNFPTEVVDEDELPVLPEAKSEVGFRLAEDGVVLVDLYGRERLCPKDQFVFAAAGRVLRMRDRPHKTLAWDHRYVPGGGVHQEVKQVTEYRLENVPEFRLEFFFAGEPARWQWVLTADNLLAANGVRLKLRDDDRLDALLQTLAGVFPAERVNLGIQRAVTGELLVYPSVRAFEEEIVWRFYRLMRGV